MRTRRSAAALLLLAVLVTAQSGVTLFAHTCQMMRRTTLSLEAPAHQCSHDKEQAANDGPVFKRVCCTLDQSTLHLRTPATPHQSVEVPVFVAVATLPEMSLNVLGMRLPQLPDAAMYPAPLDPLSRHLRLPLLGNYRI